MRAIAKMAMRSPAAASINAAAYAIFALFFAPFMVVSGAILALSTLRFGATAGLRTFAVAMLPSGWMALPPTATSSRGGGGYASVTDLSRCAEPAVYLGSRPRCDV